MRKFTHFGKKHFLLLAFMLLSSVMPTFAADDDTSTKQVIAVLSKDGEDRSIETCLRKDYGLDSFYSITNLKVIGRLYIDDYKFIRNKLRHLQILDLEDTKCFCDQDTFDAFDYTVKPKTGANLFRDLTNLQKIILPKEFSMYENTFQNCSNLTTVIFPKGFRYFEPTCFIGIHAFDGCSSLTDLINVPEGMSVSLYSFKNCSSLKSIGFEIGGSNIFEEAFKGCSSLTSVKISESVYSIDENAFNGCTSLTDINIPSGVKYIRAGAFKDCASLTTVIFSNGLKEIKDYAFFGCSNLTSVNFPDGLQTIGINAFHGCSSLASVNFPDKLQSIGDYAFSNCTNLASVNFSDDLQIGKYAFSFCTNLTSVNFSDDLRTIGENAFSNCRSLTSVNFPDKLQSIGGYAFSCCTNLASVNFPDKLQSIDEYAFSECRSLTSVNFPDNLQAISNHAFSNCRSLSMVNFPKKSSFGIGSDAFSGCKLQSLTFYTSVRLYSGSLACPNLTSITFLDENVIWGNGWTSCSPFDNNDFSAPLRSFYLNAQTGHRIKALGISSIGNCTLYVPIGRSSEFENTQPWRDFKKIVEYDFDKLTGIEKVTTDSDSQGEAHEITRYSIDGQRLNTPTQGINIVKYSDGTTKKVMVP